MDRRAEDVLGEVVLGVVGARAGHELQRVLDDDEGRLLLQGFSVAEVVLPKTRPEAVDQLGLF